MAYNIGHMTDPEEYYSPRLTDGEDFIPSPRVAESGFGNWGEVAPSEFQVVREAIKHGLPWSAFEDLKNTLEVGVAELCALTGIAQRTLARRKDQPFTPDESEKILRFGRIYQKALETLETPAGARRWLKSPKTALGGLTPLVCTDTEVGAREVEALLVRLEHGVFS